MPHARRPSDPASSFQGDAPPPFWRSRHLRRFASDPAGVTVSSTCAYLILTFRRASRPAPKFTLRLRLHLAPMTLRRSVARQVIENRFDFFQALLAGAALDTDDVDQVLEVQDQPRRKLGIAAQHGRDRLNGSPLVQQEDQELLAHQLFEARDRQTLPRLVTQAPQTIEATLVDDTLVHPNIEQCAYDGFVWAVVGY